MKAGTGRTPYLPYASTADRGACDLGGVSWNRHRAPVQDFCSLAFFVFSGDRAVEDLPSRAVPPASSVAREEGGIAPLVTGAGVTVPVPEVGVRNLSLPLSWYRYLYPHGLPGAATADREACGRRRSVLDPALTRPSQGTRRDRPDVTERTKTNEEENQSPGNNRKAPFAWPGFQGS